MELLGKKLAGVFELVLSQSLAETVKRRAMAFICWENR